MRKHAFLVISLVVLILSAALPAAAQNPNVIRVFLQAGQSNADGRGLVSEISPQYANPQTDVQIYSVIENARDIARLGRTTYSGQLIDLRPGLAEPNLDVPRDADPSTATAVIDPPEFGPEVTLGRGLADFYAATEPNTSVALIKYANGATSQRISWAAGGNATRSGDGDQYRIFQDTFNDGLEAIEQANPGATVIVSGAVWVQGEGDAGSDFSSGQYEANLSRFVQDFQLTFGADFRAANGGEELPFVIGEIGVPDTGSGGTNSSRGRRFANRVRLAQRNVADRLDGVSLVQTVAGSGSSFEHLIDVNFEDEIHFSASGQEALGFAFARQLVGVPEPSAVTLLAFSAAVGFLRRRRV